MIRILVDSSSDYTVEEIKEKNIELVHIRITLGEKTYIDGYDLGRDEFYEILQNSKDFPQTSQPSPQSFLDIFKDVKEKGDELICILLSSALSGTYQSAVLAKNMTDYDSIYLIDSLSATYTIKVMADYACRLREDGSSAAEITRKVENLKSRVKVLAALDTLEFLGRGGRISKAAAAIGDLANIKPLITISEEGKVEILGKCLGKNKAIHAILKRLEELGIDPDFPVYPIYSYGTENCAAFEKKLNTAGYSTNDMLQIGSTIGTHIGPGAFGIIFVAAS
ncbi:MAG: DegV family protein [Lachnospiraceae bacterium]|nr:DegV family protein [Lachnospiraceae bacterium]